MRSQRPASKGFFNTHFMSEIQFFDNAKLTKSDKRLKLSDYFNDIREGKWQDSVLKYRTIKDIDEQKKFKQSKIAGVTISGIFKDSRAGVNLEKHSGILCIDCDNKDNSDILDKRELLGTDKFVYSFHVSVSGYGLAIYFKINPSKHLESYLAIEKYLADNYQIITDKSCKDVSRLRFVSYDPELFLNTKSEKWIEYIKKENTPPPVFNPIYAKDDINFCISQLIDKHIDITGSYHDWIKVGFAFASEFGESGRNLFHSVSKINSSYSFNECEKKYDNFLKSNRDKTHISTFFWLCKNAGIQIKQPQTKRIEEIARVRKKQVGKNGGFKDTDEAKKDAQKYLNDFEGIENEFSEEVINKVFESNDKELDSTEESGITPVVDYINGLNAKFNEITKMTEINGEEITDRIKNSIYLTCRELFPKSKVTSDLITSILESDRIKTYNPFLEFIKKHKHLKPKGVILDVFDCIQIPKNDYATIIPTLMEKWMLSIIASVHGTYSLLILVLIGDQATNKTNFFRNFLPDELQRYYAENKLDEGKDSEILMSKRLLIVDDEFGGKSKKESEKLKDLSSKQIITARKAYGHYAEDYKRIAVLAGTSNESEVINDTTGNRRIIPVHIKSIDFEKYKAIDKTELFMELYWKWREIGNGWMLTKDEIKLLNDNTKTFTEITIEEDLIMKNFQSANETDFGAKFMTTTQMISHCENFLVKQKINVKKFGQVLRKLNFNRIQKKNIGYGYLVIEKSNNV